MCEDAHATRTRTTVLLSELPSSLLGSWLGSNVAQGNMQNAAKRSPRRGRESPNRTKCKSSLYETKVAVAVQMVHIVCSTKAYMCNMHNNVTCACKCTCTCCCKCVHHPSHRSAACSEHVSHERRLHVSILDSNTFCIPHTQSSTPSCQYSRTARVCLDSRYSRTLSCELPKFNLSPDRSR